MSLGGTSDIREGIEEGDPLKVALGTLQTVTMFAGIGVLGSTAKTAGLKAVGAIDDIAYKEAMAAIKTVMTAGEAADNTGMLRSLLIIVYAARERLIGLSASHHGIAEL